jgi:hypothetical protein
MPEGFQAVPDWFPWENQGAGVAVADLGSHQHLVVLMVDDAPGQNRGLYRIGRNLDAAGQVTGLWTPWIEIPDWFSWENQGADVAVADLSGSGGADLVIFMIDNGPGQNRGLYRIGKGLDANGAVTGGWTAWTDVPDWFPWENQGGGIAVTAPDAQGQRDLIVFMIDNAPGQNRGLYRVGKGLDANGAVTGGWTAWTDVPDWFPWENQGGGIAVADLDGDGSRDLVIFMIDNAVQADNNGGQNQGYVRIGRKLGADGAVAGWDESWSALPYWFSGENEGGGIAVADLQGRKRLLALMVDSPPGQNAGLYQVLDFAFDPAVTGRWEPVFALKNVAIHASLLPNGKALFWGRRDDPDGSLDPHTCTPWTWDPKTGSEADTANRPTHADGKPVNLFCAGHAFLPDGRLMVAGGHLADGAGSNQASTYDYRTDSWTPLPEMNNGRWYPTVTTLPDGRMLVASGTYEKNGGISNNAFSQIWDGQSWRETVSFFGLPLYPRMHVAPDGRVFMAGTNAKTYLLDVNADTWTALPEPGGPRRNGERQYAPSAMYDTGKVIYVGGGNNPGTNVPTAEGEVIDLGATPLAWNKIARMHFPRRQHNATLLPDGTLLITGGTMGVGFNDLATGRPVHAAELWDPKTGRWHLLAAEATDRCYHATTLLLPDATVLSAGGGEFYVNLPGVGQAPNDPQDSHRNAQVFRPPYLFRGPRPQITTAPEHVDFGETFEIRVLGPAIRQITWIRLPSVTHAFDENQRINFLGFTSGSGSGRLDVTVPSQPELCPPGHYMLFALSEAGVPSEAHILRVGAAAPRPHAVLVPGAAMAAVAALSGGQASIEEKDAAVCQSAGTRVTVGLTARCPYGLAACWGGAYEALKKLEGVEAVRPIANTEDSTADVYLRGQNLPALDCWPEQFARWANRSYDFRGVEVTLFGTMREKDGTLLLIGPFSSIPVQLAPLGRSAKVQWDHRAQKTRDATVEETNAYQDLLQIWHYRAGREVLVRVTGPLVRTNAGWKVRVRHFERAETDEALQP